MAFADGVDGAPVGGHAEFLGNFGEGRRRGQCQFMLRLVTVCTGILSDDLHGTLQLFGTACIRKHPKPVVDAVGATSTGTRTRSTDAANHELATTGHDHGKFGELAHEHVAIPLPGLAPVFAQVQFQLLCSTDVSARTQQASWSA